MSARRTPTQFAVENRLPKLADELFEAQALLLGLAARIKENEESHSDPWDILRLCRMAEAKVEHVGNVLSGAGESAGTAGRDAA